MVTDWYGFPLWKIFDVVGSNVENVVVPRTRVGRLVGRNDIILLVVLLCKEE